MNKLAQVIVNLPVRQLNKPFTYLIPEELDFLDIGFKVIVPFGRSKAEGFVIEISDEKDIDSSLFSDCQPLKPIIEVVENFRWFDQEMIKTSKWLSKYYMCSLAEALRLFIPGKKSVKFLKYYQISPNINMEDPLKKLMEKPLEYSLLLNYIYNEKSTTIKDIKKFLVDQSFEQSIEGKREKISDSYIKKIVDYFVENNFITITEDFTRSLKPVYETVFSLAKDIDEHKAIDIIDTALRRKPAQQKILRIFLERNCGDICLEETKKLNISRNTLNELAKLGFIEIKKVQVVRDSYLSSYYNNSNKNELTLTTEQDEALSSILKSIEENNFESFLLQGATGSGKTQVYIEAVKKCRFLNKQAIVLVPEIALTSQLIKRFKEVFVNDVAVIHSKLSLGERYDAWQRIKNSEIGIIIGTRSAIFVPAENLGLIILDEEHELTYKQEEAPRYHAKKIALKRAELKNAVVILGSATPCVETYFETINNKHTLLNMKNRINNAPLPPVSIVDMREELAQGNKTVLSKKMYDAIKETVEKKEQVIILLNRRGYSTFILCRECGYVLKCPHCDISLVYHMTSKSLHCHYCQNHHDILDTCPACQSRYIRYFGSGTQKVEKELEELFSGIRVVRMDQDTTGAKMAQDNILRDFSKGKYNVLLGTQMVAKGHDIPNVTTVGIIAADTALNLPDFRAAERTFSLIMQAAGRAGRGDKPGTVILQTYNPENYAIIAASQHDFEMFYKNEIVFREELLYPPFTNIIKITINAKVENKVIEISEEFAKELKQMLSSTKTLVIGPFQASTFKLKDIYRMNLLLKIPEVNLSEAKEQLTILLEKYYNINIFIDVDPINVL